MDQKSILFVTLGLVLIIISATVFAQGGGKACECVDDEICSQDECTSCPDCVAICQHRQDGVCEYWECPDAKDCTGEKGTHICTDYECFDTNNEWCYNGWLLRNNYCLHCDDTDCETTEPTEEPTSGGQGQGGNIKNETYYICIEGRDKPPVELDGEGEFIRNRIVAPKDKAVVSGEVFIGICSTSSMPVDIFITVDGVTEDISCGSGKYSDGKFWEICDYYWDSTAHAGKKINISSKAKRFDADTSAEHEIEIDVTEPKEDNKSDIEIQIAESGKTEELQVTVTGESTEITHKETKVLTKEEVVVENNKVFVGTEELKIMPDEIKTQMQVKEMELKQEQEKLVYVVKGTEPAMFLFIFPVILDVEQKIDAENGDVLSSQKPWWSFLAF